MHYRIAKLAAAAGAVAVLTLSSGCVRMQDVEMLQSEVDRLTTDLAAAQEAAKGAMMEAEAANAAAGSAAAAASDAMSAASDAQANAAANAEKLQRMLDKVMMK